MLLRASGAVTGVAVEVRAVTGEVTGDGGVVHGARLLAFTDAVMRGDDASLTREREALCAVLSPEAFLDVAAVIASFNVVDRIADATGIPLDDVMMAMSEDVRRELDLARFPSAANTPGMG
jgi:hypothetical protein